ncbi:hypothetical protein EDB87DRAFT_1554630 [Lactarius vividus]|nr:hypothetical protein EDB87DRAFT_1554630 [Lactarius vividus]
MITAKQLFSVVVLSAFLTLASAQAREGCSRTGAVLEDDTCDKLSARDNVSTFQLADANPVINAACDNIFPDELLCLGLEGKDCTTVTVVQSGDTCSAIASAAGISVATLLANNPNIDGGCSNIYPDEVLCTDSQIFDYN